MGKRLLLILSLFVLADIYFFQVIQTVFQNVNVYRAYWSIDVLLFGAVFLLLYLRRSGYEIEKMMAAVLNSLFIVFIPKFIAVPFLLVEDFVRLFQGFPSRSLWLSELVLFLALVLVVVIVFGLTNGRHYYKVREEVLRFSFLPEEFDGFKITQISDIHSGSLSDIKGVRKGIALANAQNSDLLLFTGDLVNNKAAEMDPWISEFNLLKAPFGKFSVLGNHDYGDYAQWESIDHKSSNLERLKEIHGEMGFRLLMNESIRIQKQGASIALVGVENWGKGGFHQYGDLHQATLDIPDDSFKILMSHDPSHWDHVVLKHNKKVDLTLAGHTHGMQFGFELFGFKWSPIQYFYKQWAGLYQQDEKYLYVNRGFGYHGLKGRIGVWPEITVITLKKSQE